MKISEMVLSNDAMKALQEYTISRLTNLGMAQKSGLSPSNCLAAEIVLLEAKLDAFIEMVEDSGIDFSKFDSYLQESCKKGTESALKLRAFMAQREQSVKA